MPTHTPNPNRGPDSGTPAPSIKGRGAAINPAGRFEQVALSVDGEYLDEQAREHPEGVRPPTTIRTETARTVINRVDSPDLGMRWTVNPYRGCEHGCIYCYARPGHEYFNLSSGLDFETQIFAKHDAPDLLERELAHRSWAGEPIVMSGVTDPYQPVERELRITRRCLEVMARCRQPVGIVTKSHLVTRDLDLLSDLARDHAAGVAISLTTLDNDLASKMEPRASAPRARLAAMKALTDAGVPVCVMTAPIVPGLNDREIPALLAAAREHGATSAGYVLLRLPHQVKDLFLDWLSRHFPDRAARVESLIRQSRDGELYDPEFFSRQRGRGPIAEAVAAVWHSFAERHSLRGGRMELSGAKFRRPSGAQMELFG